MRYLDIVYFYRGALVEEAKYESPKLSKGDFDKVWDCLKKMPEFYTNGEVRKSMRWLGFIQGLFWARGFYTLDELKHHNRGIGEEYDQGLDPRP